MKSSPGFENLDKIENDIRRRLKENDEERRALEKELTEFLEHKKSILALSKKYGDTDQEEPSVPMRDLNQSATASSNELPWGRYASGAGQVVYVVREAGAHGLGRLEVVDRIAEIIGAKPSLNSVTTWLYRAKTRGEIKNRNRRWYAA